MASKRSPRRGGQDEGLTHDRTGGDKEVARKREERLSGDMFGRIIKPGRGEIDTRDIPPSQRS